MFKSTLAVCQVVVIKGNTLDIDELNFSVQAITKQNFGLTKQNFGLGVTKLKAFTEDKFYVAELPSSVW